MTTSRKILVLFAHPAPDRSRVNARLADAVRTLPGVTFHDLYESYPELDIDVPREQALLDAHDLVVWQHPFFWYSTPAILKEWQDLVLEHGWAYGSAGTALRGKPLLLAISTGGRAEAYGPGGHNRFTVRELVAPIEQTAALCGMPFVPPFVVYGTHQLDDEGIARAARDYRRVLEALRDGLLDPAALPPARCLNELLDTLPGLGDPVGSEG